MQHRVFLAAMAMAVAAILSQPTGVRASSSTQGLTDIGTPTTDTGNINTASVFNIGDLVSTSASTGFFVGLPTQTFGAETFNITVPASLTFASAAFGSFTSTSITEISNVPGVVGFYILGNYTAGTFDSEVSGQASFTISFTQTPPGTGGISDSGTFSTPPASVTIPEPASVVLGLTSMGAFGVVVCFRRRFRNLTP